MNAVKVLKPDLKTLLDLFPAADDIPKYEWVAAEKVPHPYHGLLVHEHHMTVTVEAFHGGPVDVVVLNRRLDGESYARRILLRRQGGGPVVQFGIVRIDLEQCSAPVRAAILRADTPLGRILIQNDVLRRIEPTAFLRAWPGHELTKAFGLEHPRPTYGRTAIIHCNGKPAIELLEVVAPA
jgi:chorismate-pyruvate lyase